MVDLVLSTGIFCSRVNLFSFFLWDLWKKTACIGSVPYRLFSPLILRQKVLKIGPTPVHEFSNALLIAALFVQVSVTKQIARWPAWRYLYQYRTIGTYYLAVFGNTHVRHDYWGDIFLAKRVCILLWKPYSPLHLIFTPPPLDIQYQ